MMTLCRAVLLLLISLFNTTLAQEACSEQGGVRLVDGANLYEGRLEICVNGQWGTVCNDGLQGLAEFDINAARVACRQLGIPESDLSDVVTNIFFGGGGTSQPIHLDELQCSGTETTLLNCTHNGIGVQDCGHPEDVGIICLRSQDCTDGDVRLVDEDNYNATEGRVEYCVGGRWGTVCNYLWGDTDAVVVCRQLGLNALDPRALTANVSQVKRLQTPIVLDGLNCRGIETRLDTCGHLLSVEDCSHSNDAGAFCGECNNDDVRLFQVEEGQKENEGRVEICSSARWGLVCFNNWDNNDAKVVCRQLGYDVENGSALATQSRLGRDPPPTLLNRVNCVGTESSLFSQCPTDSISPCHNPNTVAGVMCPIGVNENSLSRNGISIQKTTLELVLLVAVFCSCFIIFTNLF